MKFQLDMSKFLYFWFLWFILENIDKLCFLNNQIVSDFAFLPFGGGPRKCVGDQFALMESTVALAMLLQNFDVELKGTPESVELVTGATIHTKNGLWCNL